MCFDDFHDATVYNNGHCHVVHLNRLCAYMIGPTAGVGLCIVAEKSHFVQRQKEFSFPSVDTAIENFKLISLMN